MMETRHLGKTGLIVSRLGLGLAALGRPGYINLGHADDLHSEYDVAAMEANAHAVLDAAWEGGVRYFDAARSYGRAEDFLASWLASREVPPGDVTVGSKWGYTYTAGWRVDADRHEVKDHSLPTLVRQLFLESVAATLGISLDGLALAAALARAWADVVLSGAPTVEQLRSNLAALQVPWEDTIDDELRSVAEEPQEYWAVRGKLPWN